jgi:putative endonuclease
MPWELVFSEKYEDFVLAKRRELEIKKKKSRIYIESLIRDIDKTKLS